MTDKTYDIHLKRLEARVKRQDECLSRRPSAFGETSSQTHGT
jgi:hypothetical protein